MFETVIVVTDPVGIEQEPVAFERVTTMLVVDLTELVEHVVPGVPRSVTLGLAGTHEAAGKVIVIVPPAARAFVGWNATVQSDVAPAADDPAAKESLTTFVGSIV